MAAVNCSRCGSTISEGELFESVIGDRVEEDLECAKCRPPAQRYRDRPGIMADWLPGGKKYTGAIHEGGSPDG